MKHAKYKFNRLIYGLLLLCTGFSSSYAQEVVWKKRDGHVIATVNWCEVYNSGIQDDASLSRLDCPTANHKDAKVPRITSDTTVTVRVTNFNFLKYNIKYKIDEEQLQAYTYLAGIWEQFLGFNPQSLPGRGPASEDVETSNERPSTDTLTEWWQKIANAKSNIHKELQLYTHPALSSEQITQLQSFNGRLNTLTSQLTEAKLNAFAEIASDIDLQKYEIINREHEAVIKTISDVSTLATKSLNGDTQSIGIKSAGTIVSIAITPEATTGSTSTVTSKNMSYLVESTYPLLFHIGLTHTQFNDSEFSTVRALGGRDLFTKVKDQDGTDSFSAFLSYPIDGGLNDANWFATLGADIKNFDERLYVGVSRKFSSRWFVTVGGAYGQVTSGVNPIAEAGTTDSDPDAMVQSNRTLFELIKEDREWEAFLSISVKLF